MTRKELLNNVSDKIINCNKCYRLREITKYPMPHIYYNNLSKVNIFIVGQNPGTENNYSKVKIENFIKKYHDLWWECRVGKYIRKEFGDDFLKEKIFFTNICKCSSPKNSKLEKEEVENCKQFLLDQLKIIRPKIIITLGNEAEETINSLDLFDKVNIINLFHPSYFRYNNDPDLIKIQSNKIKKIKEQFINDDEKETNLYFDDAERFFKKGANYFSFHSGSNLSTAFRYNFACYAVSKQLKNIGSVKEYIKVLDLGCGICNFISFWGNRFCAQFKPRLHYIGLEYDKKRVEYVANNFPSWFEKERRTRVEMHQFDLINKSLFDLNENKFDSIIAMEVLEHIGKEAAERVICEINKLLNKNGIL
ncbi:MAG: uracil-DNA glycosylase family protein, partial [bacterium]